MARSLLSLVLVALCLASATFAFDYTDCFTRDDNWWDVGAKWVCENRASCIQIGTTIEYQYDGSHNVYSATKDIFDHCDNLYVIPLNLSCCLFIWQFLIVEKKNCSLLIFPFCCCDAGMAPSKSATLWRETLARKHWIFPVITIVSAQSLVIVNLAWKLLSK